MLLTPSYYSFPVGAVVGGSVGGLALVAIILALLYLWRKRHAPILAEIDPEPNCDAEYQSSYAPSQNMSYTPFPSPSNATNPLYPKRSPTFISESHNADARATSPSIADSLASPVHPTSTADSAELCQGILSIEKNPGDDATFTQSPVSLSSSSGGNQLTDAQADFVNGLYTHNVPAPAIAHIVQRMMSGLDIGDIDKVSAAADDHDVAHGNTTASVAPPSYSES